MSEEIVVQVFEVTDPIDVRRAKYAQYGGAVKAIRLGSQTVTGIIRSVVAVPASKPERWIVTFYPKAVRQPIVAPEAAKTRHR